MKMLQQKRVGGAKNEAKRTRERKNADAAKKSAGQGRIKGQVRLKGTVCVCPVNTERRGIVCGCVVCAWWRLGHGQSRFQANHDGPPYVCWSWCAVETRLWAEPPPGQP